MKCLLCKDNEANQPGSHIFTHSLIHLLANVLMNKEKMAGIKN